MRIDANFDAGNIIVNEMTDTNAVLSIRADSGAKFYQWFHFRVSGARGMARTFRISNAGSASYPTAWPGYEALASYNEQDWFRVPTQYDGTNLIFEHKADEETTSYAFFVPYPAARREHFLKECEASPLATRRQIGTTLQGRPLDMLVIGDEKRPIKKVWIVARQHAGEPMAEWYMEGLIRRLLDSQDSQARQLIGKATLYAVMNMNPDGSMAGNLRANAAGVDLNRAWNDPQPNAPEVIAARNLIGTTGVDFFLDVHGDEERPFIWLVGPHPSNVTPDVDRMQKQFEAMLAEKYAEVRPRPDTILALSRPDSGMSVDYVASVFHCPALIIELPFKKTVSSAGEQDSLLAAGCIEFGRSSVEVLNAILTA
jgi:murein tripeptide amidase MpaA